MQLMRPPKNSLFEDDHSEILLPQPCQKLVPFKADVNCQFLQRPNKKSIKDKWPQKNFEILSFPTLLALVGLIEWNDDTNQRIMMEFFESEKHS